MKTLLWLDDVRNPHENDWLNFSPVQDYEDVVWVKDWWGFTNWINTNGLPYAICFDHDLECFYKNREYTGYDCAWWLINYCIDKDRKELPHWNIHSANPIGAENIRGLLNNFDKKLKIQKLWED